MTPNYRNFPPIFPFELSSEDHDLSHPLVSPNYRASSSSSHSSCQIFFNSATQYQTGHHDHTELFLPEYQPKVDNYASSGGSYDLEKKNKAESDINLTLWKRKDRDEKNMRLKQKLEDQKQQSSTRLETDHSSNSSSNNSNNFPIRVCADCNTTKTPLWRGGPKGPKSLCNACGIRQRKARKAMAAAAAAAAEGTTLTTEKSTVVKIKLKKKEKTTNLIATNHIKPYKKRWRLLDTTDGSSSSSDSQNKKLRFEDLFTNLSKKLAVNFPEDEKEAAILLMALSCGLVIHS